MPRHGLAALLACLVALAAPMPRATAQVAMIIPFPAGGATDLLGRLIQPELSAALGTQVVIRNVGGASGVIGATEAARARPDGTTLFLSPAGPVAIQLHMRNSPPYRAESFAPICQVADSPVIMMTPKASGMRTLADVLGRARAAGGTFPYGSSGIGTIPHISMVGLTRSAGVPMLHVPFRGSADVMHAFAQGTVALFNDQAVLIRQYDLHAIAALTEDRAPDFPDTPTMRELGHDLVFSIWSGLYAPAGTPAEAIARAEAACRRTMETPAVREGLQRIAQPVRFRDSREFAAFTRDESAKFRALIDAAGMCQAE
jgi:tripartite-type tricarboxylate transporter receptor subunit TctC